MEDRLHSAVHRSTVVLGMLRDTRLTVAPLGTTWEIHTQCSIIKMQRGKTRLIYSLLEEVERQQSVTIASMYDYSTKTANLYQSPSPPSPTCRLLSNKNGISSHFRHKYPETRQNRGIPKSRNGRKYLQVLRPYLQVPKGTQYKIPAGQSFKPRNKGSANRRGPTAHGASAQGDNGASEPCYTHKPEPWHPPLKESVPFHTELPTKAYHTHEVYRNLKDAKPRLLRTVEHRNHQIAEKHIDTNRGAAKLKSRGSHHILHKEW